MKMRFGALLLFIFALSMQLSFSSPAHAATGDLLGGWGTKGTGKGEFFGLRGVTVGPGAKDGGDLVYMVDYYNNKIELYDLDGVFMGTVGSKGTGEGQFTYPYALALDSLGNIYVADKGNTRIMVFNPDRTFKTTWGSAGDSDGQFNSTLDIAIDSNDNVYVLDRGNQASSMNTRVQVFDPDGRFLRKWGSYGTGDGQFITPAGIAIDSNDEVYVVDSSKGSTSSHRVQVFDSLGNLQRQWGSYGSGDGQFNAPWGIGVGPDDYLYVTDFYNHRVQVFNSDGAFLAKWGSHGTNDGQFSGPGGIDVDSRNRVYVADYVSGRIQVFDGTVSKNSPPVANAGVDQTLHIGSVATLDGSASFDPEKDYPLSYSWKITSMPTGSVAKLSDPRAVNPSFTPDYMGDYTVVLYVKDSLGLLSAPDSVVVSTWNTAPVADAGKDQSIELLGSMVQLDGSTSYDDDDNEPLQYIWTMISKPKESMAKLSDPDSATPTFIADVQGDYVFELIVSDGWNKSDPDSVTVSFNNIAPVADAGGNQAVAVGDVVYLDGTKSSDANGDLLTYDWSFVSRPAGSWTKLSDPSAMRTNFITDMAGNYVVSLVVYDGLLESNPANINVRVVTIKDQTTETLIRLIEFVNRLEDPAAVLKNIKLINALTSKINAVIEMIDSGRYREALTKLETDLIGKTDGCAIGGTNDKNDWILDCSTQELVYPYVVKSIDLLKKLI